MTRKAIVPSVAAIAVIGLIAGVRHCLQTMAPSGGKSAPVERCGRPRHRYDSAEQAATTTAAAA